MQKRTTKQKSINTYPVREDKVVSKIIKIQNSFDINLYCFSDWVQTIVSLDELIVLIKWIMQFEIVNAGMRIFIKF